MFLVLSKIGFLTNVAMPCFSTLSEVIPTAKFLLEGCKLVTSPLSWRYLVFTPSFNCLRINTCFYQFDLTMLEPWECVIPLCIGNSKYTVLFMFAIHTWFQLALFTYDKFLSQKVYKFWSIQWLVLFKNNLYLR